MVKSPLETYSWPQTVNFKTRKIPQIIFHKLQECIDFTCKGKNSKYLEESHFWAKRAKFIIIEWKIPVKITCMD